MTAERWQFCSASEAEQESSWQVDGRKAARQRKQHMQRQGQHEDGGTGAVRADTEGHPE